MQGLVMFRFPPGTCIVQAQPPERPAVTLLSPGVSVMTDLTEVRAATTSPRETLRAARETMIHQGVRLLFVVETMPCVEGVVTAADLEGERPMQALQRRGVTYDELTVADVMTPLSEFDAIDYAELRRSNVGDVIQTLKRVGRRHLLVAEAATAAAGPRIRGIISHTQIERQLGQPIDVLDVAATFSEIRASLAA